MNDDHSKFLQTLCQISSKEKFSSVNELINASNNFNRTICKAPTKDNWIKKSMDENSLETFLKFANSAYPILHEDVLFLSEQFLQIKKDHGNLSEKTFYQPMNVIDLIDRLIKKVVKIRNFQIMIYIFDIE